MADIDKLLGAPFSNIVSWLWVEWEKWSPDPTKKETNPFNDLGTSVGDPKEKLRERPHVDHEKLQVVTAGLVNKVNLIITEVNKIPALQDAVDQMEITLTSHSGQSSAHHVQTQQYTPPPPPAGGDTGGGRRGGLIKNLQEGGKARTTPVQTSREDFKAILIRDILELQEK